MTVSEIYKKYSVPPNLSAHMLTVVKVIKVIKKYWTGVDLDWHEMTFIGLLHDVGNIVKFDLDRYPDLLGNEINNIEFWKEEQKKIIRRYGKDDHLVTKKILEELGLSLHFIEVIRNKSFVNIIEISNSEDWYTKILAYADLRVLPGGIGSLDERIEDIKKRMPKYANREDLPDLIKAAFKIGAQIQKVVDLPLNKISDEIEKIDIDDIDDEQLLLMNII